LSESPATDRAELRIEGKGTPRLLLLLEGSLSHMTLPAVWKEATRVVRESKPATLVVEASGVDYLDGSGAALIYELRRLQILRGATFSLEGLAPSLATLLEVFHIGREPKARTPRPPRSLVVEIGEFALTVFHDARSGIALVGESLLGFLHALRHPGQVRWKDTLVVAEKSGVNSLPVTALVSMLVGLIIAYQSSAPLRSFGAEIYIADMIGISMVRELGPLMAAIVLAARTGSAYAAEIGAMTVNEEVDALTTMGLDPVRFLAIPRLLAGIVMAPCVTIFAILVGVFGGGIVATLSLGLTPRFFVDRVLDTLATWDLVGGLLKSIVFGIIVAAVGCHRGLETRRNASGVGDAATSAVVTCLVLIIATDGVFAVVFFTLGI